MELHNLTITEAHKGLKAKKFSSRELTQACLQRIDKLEDNLNAFVTITAESALEQADKVDKLISKGEAIPPLAGIPIAVKDNICTKGVETTAGSNILKGFVPPYDATVVSKLGEQQAVIIGKTNLDEFAMGSSTENSAFGPTKNPHDNTRVPGGSSGGSAAAVAVGMCLGAFGSDTGGSIRQPASFCGVVGFKPTYGAISRYGLIALTSSLDQIGPLAKSVGDTKILFDAVAGRDPYDSTTLRRVVENNPNKTGRAGLRGIKIGIPKEYFGEGLDSQVEKTVRQAVDQLESLGAEILEVSLPHTETALACYYIINPSEASSNLARYDGVRFGQRADGATFAEEYVRTRSEGFGDEVKRRIMLGTYALSAGYYDAFYVQASKVRTLVKKDFETAFEKVNVLVCPTTPTTAFKLGEKHDPLAMYLADIFTIPANLAGICGMSIPCGQVDNLPVGLQLLGPQQGEGTLFQVGEVCEHVTGRSLKHRNIEHL